MDLDDPVTDIDESYFNCDRQRRILLIAVVD